jgi:hypothetical protein
LHTSRDAATAAAAVCAVLLDAPCTHCSAGPPSAAACWLLTNAADLHACTCQGTQGALCTRAGGLGLVATGGAQLDVQGSDAQLLWGKHSSSRVRQVRNGGKPGVGVTI